ncbi:MAG: DUF952 domain-containing protein [Caulobacteraceae bacterium]
MSRIYKILPRAAWDEAVAQGRFDGSPIDLQDGYIHFSTAEQAQETAAKHFGGQQGLVVAAFDTDDLGPALRWEPFARGAAVPPSARPPRSGPGAGRERGAAGPGRRSPDRRLA